MKKVRNISFMAGLLLCLCTVAVQPVYALTAGPQITIPPGPIEGEGWPMWFEDGNGVRLELCLDITCAPLVRGRVLQEAVYYSVDKFIQAPSGERYIFSAAITALPDPLTGLPTVTNAIRVRLRDLVFPGDYFVRTPFGDFGPFFGGPPPAADIDAEIQATTGLPPDFSGALTGPVQTFWSNGTGTGTAPGSLYGDGLTEAPLQGVNTPNGSLFRIIGPPGSNIDIQETTFTVSGRIFIPIQTVITTPLTVTRATYGRAPGKPPVVSVFADSEPGASVVVNVQGMAPAPLNEDPPGSGKFYARFAGPRFLPGALDVTAEAPPLPLSLKNAALKDQITVTAAVYTTGLNGKGRLNVRAVSSDKRPFSVRPALTVFDQDENELGRINEFGELVVTGLTRPPRAVTVRSLMGAEASVLTRIK